MEEGVVVSHVDNFGQAGDSNLRENQVIFEGRVGNTIVKINSVSKLTSFLKDQKPGEPFLLRVYTDANGNTAFIPLEFPE